MSWAKTYLNLDLAQSVVSRILKKADQFKNVTTSIGQYRRIGTVRNPDIENKLTRWFYKHQHNVNMSGELIKKKAERIRDDSNVPAEDFKISSMWLEGFKKRHGIRDRRRHGESGEVDMELVENERPKIKEILDSYELEDIYNMDETGLFYQQEVRVW